MKHSILIYDKYNSITNYMLADLKKLDNVEIVHVITIKCESKHKAVYYFKKLCAKSLWAFRKRQWINKNVSQGINTIITNEAMLGLKENDIDSLKERGCTVMALLIDPLKAKYSTISCIKDVLKDFDAVYTFDPSDAGEYGLNYTNQLYSVISPVKKVDGQVSDLYYIGHLKGRELFLSELISKGKEQDASLNIQLLGKSEEGRQVEGAEYLKKRVPYEEVVNRLNYSKCILDITQEGQTGITLRYYEAVVYNKKLLTNNKSIVSLPFYDSRYMKIYQGAGEIDWDWVKNDDMPDYKYNGEFSPINLIRRVES